MGSKTSKYRCLNAYAECHKFDLFLEEQREEIEIFAKVEASVELTCGESTEYDNYIRWRKLNGVNWRLFLVIGCFSFDDPLALIFRKNKTKGNQLQRLSII